MNLTAPNGTSPALFLQAVTHHSEWLSNPEILLGSFVEFDTWAKVSSLWRIQLDTTGAIRSISPKKTVSIQYLVRLLTSYIGGLINYFNPFQLSGLTVGSSYMLCVDLDGDGPLPLGPTGLEAWMKGQWIQWIYLKKNTWRDWSFGSFQVFATNVASASPITINDAPGQLLSLTCDSATW